MLNARQMWGARCSVMQEGGSQDLHNARSISGADCKCRGGTMLSLEPKCRTTSTAKQDGRTMYPAKHWGGSMSNVEPGSGLTSVVEQGGRLMSEAEQGSTTTSEAESGGRAEQRGPGQSKDAEATWRWSAIHSEVLASWAGRV